MLNTYERMIPFSMEKLSVGNPAMFHARVLTGSPKVWIREKSSEHGIPFFLTSLTHCCTWSCYKKIYTQYILWNFEGFVWFMVFNATFNNISVISWQLVLLVEKTWVSRENNRPVASHWQTLSQNVVSSTPRQSGVQTHNVSGDRHWLHSCYKSNYHTIMTMTAPRNFDGSRQ